MAIEKNSPVEVGTIILAAGASTRLGRPKQGLLYNGKTLLQHTAEVALASSAGPVVVVLGATAATNPPETFSNDVQVVMNPEWQEGMASSIRCGLKTMLTIYPAAEGVILMVCDQPFVSTSLLNDLVAAYQKTGKPVVASGYASTFGPPVFFHCSLFDQLLQLKGDTGARHVVRQHAESAEIIPFPEGQIDIDTEADYERLKERGEE